MEETNLIDAVTALREEARVVLADCEVFRLMPRSGKLLIFDSRLSVKSALNGLLEHDHNCAPVFDSVALQYVGMLTVTDFLDILLYSYDQDTKTHQQDNNNTDSVTTTTTAVVVVENNDKSITKVAQGSIRDWQAMKAKQGTSVPRLLTIQPEESALQAVKTLHKHHIHRLAVMQVMSDSILSILTHHRITHFLIEARLPCLTTYKLQDLSDVLTEVDTACYIHKDTTLLAAQKLLFKHKLYTLPVMSTDGKNTVLASYQRKDVRNVAFSNSYAILDTQTVDTVLTVSERAPESEGFVTLASSLDVVLRQFVKTGRHVLFAVASEHDHTLLGSISLASILGLIVDTQQDTLVGEAKTSSSPSIDLDSLAASMSNRNMNQEEHVPNLPLFPATHGHLDVKSLKLRPEQ